MDSTEIPSRLRTIAESFTPTNEEDFDYESGWLGEKERKRETRRLVYAGVGGFGGIVATVAGLITDSKTACYVGGALVAVSLLYVGKRTINYVNRFLGGLAAEDEDEGWFEDIHPGRGDPNI